MAGTMTTHPLGRKLAPVVSMESGLDGRNNVGDILSTYEIKSVSQWSPA